MHKMNMYGIKARIGSILLLIVFVFVAAQPVRTCSAYLNAGSALQNHLENLTVAFTPDWQKDMTPGKILIGRTWDIFLKNVRISGAPDINGYDIHLLVAKANAP